MKKFFTLLTAFVLLTSCHFLDEKPTTSLGDEDAYGSTGALEAQIYGVLMRFYGDAMITGNMNEFLMDCSGLIHWGDAPTRLTDAQQRWTCSFAFTQYSSHPLNYNEYCGFFAVVDRATRLLEHLPDSPVDEGFKREIGGEARFYRALAYFYLVRGWGDVPLRTRTATNYEESNAPRDAFWKVYAQIVEDLEYAFENMRDYGRTLEVAGQAAGRPCRWAAQSLLSYVYLTIGTLTAHSDDNFWDPAKRQERYGVSQPDFSGALDGITASSSMEEVSKKAFEEALRCAEDVIEHGPYELAPKYQDLFRWTNPEDYTLKERIFVLTNSPESGTSASNYTAIRSLPRFPEGTANVSVNNNNYGRWRPTRFVYQKWCETHGGVKGDAQTTSEIYVSCPDPRFDVTIWHDGYTRQDTGDFLELYPSPGRVFNRIYNADMEPFFRKYLDPTYDANSGRADFYVLRFAEVYLIAAEAAANLSTGAGDANWQKAMGYVETVHARARRSVPDGEPDAEFPKWESNRFQDAADPHQALINGIFWERIFELYAEGHEYWDTHRMGATWMAENIAQPIVDFLLLPEQQYDRYDRAAPNDRNFCLRHYGSNTPPYRTAPADLRGSLILEFPQQEIVSNHGISQEDAMNDFHTVLPITQ